MGMIRKSLAVGSLGVVSGSSKKQRFAQAQLTELKKLNAANGIAPSTFGQPRGTGAGNWQAQRIVNKTRRTHPGILAAQAQPQPLVIQPPAPPKPVDLIKSPDGQHYWDGRSWCPMPTEYTWDGRSWCPMPTEYTWDGYAWRPNPNQI